MNNYTGTPDQIKIIAEAVGWTNVYITASMEPLVLGIPPDCSMHEEYNPSTNAEQTYEIEEWLVENEYIITIGKFRSGLYSVDVTRVLHECYMRTGKTRAEAVLSAIWETIKVVK